MWFVAEFLTKVDGGTMRHALEARSPFLDHTLWEFAAKLPPQLRLRSGTLKAILREIVRKRVSPEVALRRKQGFTVPVGRWINKQWSGALESLGSGSRLVDGGWMNREVLARCTKQVAVQSEAPVQFWYLIVLERWLRHIQG